MTDQLPDADDVAGEWIEVRPAHWWADWRLWAALTALLLTSAVVLALVVARADLAETRGDLADARQEDRCRSAIAGRVSIAAAANMQAVGDGLAAVATEDSTALRAAVRRQRITSAALDDALELRSDAERRCR